MRVALRFGVFYFCGRVLILWLDCLVWFVGYGL